MPAAAGFRTALLASAFLATFAAPAQALRCPADRIDLQVRVSHVYDGDTVLLEDGRRVRFIGINTPEHGRDGAADEPFANAATAALRALLEAHEGILQLRLDEERSDRYGRLLAHAFLADGRSVDRILLQRGLALHITVPPNSWNRRCYSAAEALARDAGRGLWSHARYRGVAATRLARDATGFRVVDGTIRRVGEGRRAWWLVLDGLTLRLAKDDLAYFGDLEPSRLRGRNVRVRGWIYRVHGEARMNLRHLDALQFSAEK